MNIRVDLNYPIKDGTEVVFRSPVDCSQVTGLKVYYPNGSQEFSFADAHGNNVGDIDHLFSENVVVKVILDVTTGMAFVQNADTNAYLEGRFASVEGMIPPGIVNEASGNVITLKDSSNRKLQGLTLKGKNIADIYGFSANGISSPASERVMSNSYGTTLSTTGPSDVLEITQSKIVNNNAVSYANGYFCIGFYHDIKDGDTVSLSFDVEITNNLSDNNNIVIMVSGSEAYDATITSGRFKTTLQWVNNGTKKYIEIRNGGKSMIISNIQVEYGATATPYVPYFSGGDVTVKVMGKNIADIYGFSASIINEPTTNRYLSNGYGTTVSTTEPSDTLVVTQTKVEVPSDPPNYRNGYFVIGFYNDLKDGDSVTVSFDAEVTNDLIGNQTISFIPNSMGNYSASARIENGKVKAKLQWAKNDSNSDMQCLVIRNCGKSMVISNFQIEYGDTATEYEPYKGQTLVVSVPNGLGDEGVVCEDCAQLHTYKPNTTITNDVGAIMEVEYVADTKTYIDNKFAELANAIVNNA